MNQPTSEQDAREAEIKELARKHAELAISTLAEVMDDTDAPPVAKVQAAKAMLDRGFGQPSRKVEQKVDVNIVDTRRAHLEAMKKVASLPPPRRNDIIDAEFTEVKKG